MKKLLLLIACACAISIHPMDPAYAKSLTHKATADQELPTSHKASQDKTADRTLASSENDGQASQGTTTIQTKDNQTIPLDKQVQGHTVSIIKEFKRFFNTEPDPNKVPNFEFGQLTPDNCRTVLTEAARQHQGLKIITGMDLLLKRQTAPKEIFYLGLLQIIKNKLEPVVPADLIYDKEVSTFSDFQTFLKRQPDLCTIIKFKFSKLTADERANVFQEAEGQSQALGERVTKTIAGEQISGFKITAEIILYLEMLKEIKDNLAPESPTK